MKKAKTVDEAGEAQGGTCDADVAVPEPSVASSIQPVSAELILDAAAQSAPLGAHEAVPPPKQQEEPRGSSAHDDAAAADRQDRFNVHVETPLRAEEKKVG